MTTSMSSSFLSCLCNCSRILDGNTRKSMFNSFSSVTKARFFFNPPPPLPLSGLVVFFILVLFFSFCFHHHRETRFHFFGCFRHLPPFPRLQIGLIERIRHQELFRAFH